MSELELQQRIGHLERRVLLLETQCCGTCDAQAAEKKLADISAQHAECAKLQVIRQGEEIARLKNDDERAAAAIGYFQAERDDLRHDIAVAIRERSRDLACVQTDKLGMQRELEWIAHRIEAGEIP